MDLLKQADEMQRALRQLEALESAVAHGTNGATGEGNYEEEEDEEVEAEEERADAGGEDEEAVLARLRSLEEEKQRFEGMLRASQQEHQDLQQRLEDMRALMESLGMREGDEDD